MSRQLRIEYPGAIYHVMSHGNGFQWIYKGGESYSIFLELLKEVRIKYNFIIHTFIFMRNHFHILVETPLGNLSKGMLYFNREFSRRFNKTNKRKGSVLKSRYKSLLVEKEEYYKVVYRYINQNSIRAGLGTKVEDYYGGIWHYMDENSMEKKMINEIIDWNKVLENLCITRIDKIKNWLNEEEVDDIKNESLNKYFYGNKRWIEEIKQKHINDNRLTIEIEERGKLKKKKTEVGTIYKNLSRYKGQKHYKNLLIYFLSKYSQMTQKEIAIRLNLKDSNTVGQRLYHFKKVLQRREDINEIISEIEKSKI